MIGFLLVVGVGVGPAVMGAALAPQPVHTVKASRYLVYKQDPEYFKYEFASPSGNLRCQITQYEDSAPWGCIAMKHTWKAPKLGDYFGVCSSKPRLTGAVISPFPGAGFTRLCKGLLPGATHRGKTLPVNTRIVVNGITCTSLRARGAETIQCSGPKRVSFVVAEKSLTLHLPRSGKD